MSTAAWQIWFSDSGKDDSESEGTWRSLANSRDVEAAFAKYHCAPTSPNRKFNFVNALDGRSFYIDFDKMKRFNTGGGWRCVRRIAQRAAEPARPPAAEPARPTAPATVLPLVQELLRILRTSAVLGEVLPDVRRAALEQSLRLARTEEDALQILVENVATSPYLPSEQKDALGSLVLQRAWGPLRAALRCAEADRLPPPHPLRGEPEASLDDFLRYREMVVLMFSRSQKIRGLPSERKRALGAAMHRCASVQELQALSLATLETSLLFSGVERDAVANDIFDHRYDRLLLPDRFDCDEAPRNNAPRLNAAPVPEEEVEAEAEPEGCPVCLEDTCVDVHLPCAHKLCSTCVNAWAARFGAGAFTCPLCRAPATLAEVLPVPRDVPSPS